MRCKELSTPSPLHPLRAFLDMIYWLRRGTYFSPLTALCSVLSVRLGKFPERYFPLTHKARHESRTLKSKYAHHRKSILRAPGRNPVRSRSSYLRILFMATRGLVQDRLAVLRRVDISVLAHNEHNAQIDSLKAWGASPGGELRPDTLQYPKERPIRSLTAIIP